MLKFTKCLVRLVVVLLLLFGLSLATVPWWGPATFDRVASGILKSKGFSDTVVSLERIGLGDLVISVEHLCYKEVVVTDAEVTLGYDWMDLWRGELEQVIVAHPKVEIDVTLGLPSSEEPDQSDEPFELSERLPLKNFELVDAVVTLEGLDWSRQLSIDAELTASERLHAKLTLSTKGLQLKAQVDALWPELTGRATVTATVEEVVEWIDFGRDRDWLTLPDGLIFSTGETTVEGGSDFTGGSLQSWNVGVATIEIDAAMNNERLSAEKLELDARGAGTELNDIEARLTSGTVGFEKLVLVFDQFLASSRGAKELSLKLLQWELSGETPTMNLGAVSGSAGNMELVVQGGWRAWHSDFTPENLSAHLGIAEGALSFYSGLGSASGTLNLDAGISTGGMRSLTLSADLKEASLVTSGASMESAHLKASVRGVIPDALEATFSVSDSQLSWSDGAGLLSGLAGDVEFKSLLPPKTKDRQTLQFSSIQQGDFTSGFGQMSFTLAEDAEKISPFTAEIAARALGGDIRVVVNGRTDTPASLAFRIYLTHVELEQLAALFPQFDGRIEGLASGELGLRLEGSRVGLEPGSLQLVPNTNGRFEYLRQGWLTQNPDLSPEAFVMDRDILNIMKDPQGAQVITELALRDLAMSGFQLHVLVQNTGDQCVLAKIKGSSKVKGITVPVVLDVPIRGDLKETINAVLKFNSRM